MTKADQAMHQMQAIARRLGAAQWVWMDGAGTELVVTCTSGGKRWTLDGKGATAADVRAELLRPVGPPLG